jgi:hypothetical protein
MGNFIDLLGRSLLCICPYCQMSFFVPEEAFDEEGCVDLECSKCGQLTIYRITQSEEGEGDVR